MKLLSVYNCMGSLILCVVSQVQKLPLLTFRSLKLNTDWLVLLITCFSFYSILENTQLDSQYVYTPPSRHSEDKIRKNSSLLETNLRAVHESTEKYALDMLCLWELSGGLMDLQKRCALGLSNVQVSGIPVFVICYPIPTKSLAAPRT